MKQGKGTDVLGTNDPRSDAIGVIYVSPNDDRKSVLAAILTQEKLGRKQVAVVLPSDQNKAFQRPGDFDDLKTMRRKLQTQIVFIASGGPGPAEFARQRRFLVYSSLENYAKALRDETQVESASKKGWLFGSPRPKADSAPAASNVRRLPTEPLLPATQELDTPAHGRSTQYDSDENKPRRNGSGLPFVAGAALGGGVAIAADSAINSHAHDGGPANPASTDPLSDPPHIPHDFADDADALAPLPVTPARTPEPADLSGPTQAIPSSHNADAADGGSIIELRPRRSSKATLPLTPRESTPDSAAPGSAPESDSTTQLPRPKRSSSKIAAAGVGAVAGGAAVSAAAATPTRAAASQGRASAAKGQSTVTPRPGGPGGIPPRGTPPGDGRGNGRGPTNSRSWIVVGLGVLIIALIACGTMAYAQPKSLPGQLASSVLSRSQSPATITITPNSQTVQDTYTLVGANTTNATTREVAVRTITGASQSPATPVKATGQAQHAAIAATGRITFNNPLTFDQQVNAGTTFNLGGGLQIITDAAVDIPPLVGSTIGSNFVSAHANPPGTVGNIGALTINNLTCCGSGSGIVARNLSAFTGGQDAVNYSFLQQSDVNSAISQSIMNITKQDTLNDLTKQLRTGEQFLGSTRCKSTLQADEPIGDSGTNVNSANVSYAIKCTATAYDNQGAQNIVKGLLSQKASSTLGPGYVLVNNIQASLTSQTETKNTLSLFFGGKGVWAYQFSDAQKLQLAKALAGKTVAEAQRILKSTPGISNATINVNGGSTLPANYNQISIVTQPVAGLSGGGTPPPTVGPPTVTGPTIRSGTPGANGKGGSAPLSGGGS